MPAQKYVYRLRIFCTTIIFSNKSLLFVCSLRAERGGHLGHDPYEEAAIDALDEGVSYVHGLVVAHLGHDPYEEAAVDALDEGVSHVHGLVVAQRRYLHRRNRRLILVVSEIFKKNASYNEKLLLSTMKIRL